MFQTKNLNYKMLSKDSLDAVRQYVLTENNFFDTGKSYLLTAHKNRSDKWKPYINLLRPITNYLTEKELNVTIIASNRIDPNYKKIAPKIANKKNGTNTIILIPLFDYSREQKIVKFRNSQFALNSTLVFNHSLHRQWINEYNTKFCFLSYGLNESIDIVKERIL